MSKKNKVVKKTTKQVTFCMRGGNWESVETTPDIAKDLQTQFERGELPRTFKGEWFFDGANQPTHKTKTFLCDDIVLLIINDMPQMENKVQVKR